MAVVTMQDAYQHIKSSLGFSTLPKDTSTCRPEESTSDPPITRRWLNPLTLSHHREAMFCSHSTQEHRFGLNIG